jgi:hypothetical protein
MPLPYDKLKKIAPALLAAIQGVVNERLLEFA